MALLFRKMSSHAWDILLTNVKLESTYNKVFNSMDPRVEEAFFKGILDSLDTIFTHKDENGELIEINQNIIMSSLEKNFRSTSMIEPLRYWEKQGSLDWSIEVINKRKMVIKNQGYEHYLKTFL